LIFFTLRIEALLRRRYRGGKKATLHAGLQAQLVEKLRLGEFRRAKGIQRWCARNREELALTTIYTGGKSRRSLGNAAQDSHAKGRVQVKPSVGRQPSAGRLVADPARPVRLWVADEHRYGLLPVIRRCWALRGVRVTLLCHQVPVGYLYEALEVDGENG